MSFYQLIQLDPASLYAKTAKTNDPKEKRRYRLAAFVRSLLIVIFAVFFISLMTGLFGAYNSSMAVSLFCILLAIRFVGFGYNIADSLVNLAIVFAILLCCPVLAFQVNLFFKLLIYIGSLLVILVMTAQKPQMGNGGLYTFSFVFLCQNPVYGQEFEQRAWMTLVGFLLCGLVLWRNHKNEEKDVRFWNILKNIRFDSKLFQWQLRLALGVGLVLGLFSSLHLEKFMWIGFACGSLLSDYNVDNNIHEKFRDRLIGAVIGSLAFYVVYLIVPARYYPFFGPVGGLCLGLCTEYKHKTMLNCFGALMSAVGLFGLGHAVVIRILYTLLGIVFALAFYYLYDRFVMKGLLKKEDDPIAQSFEQN